MSDGSDILDQINSAGDLQALEAVRVSALGKSGQITALLKSLGSMDAGTRSAEAPKIHALREQVTSAIADRGCSRSPCWNSSRPVSGRAR